MGKQIKTEGGSDMLSYVGYGFLGLFALWTVCFFAAIIIEEYARWRKKKEEQK